MTKNHWGAAYLTLAASIWGGMYVVSKAALAVIPPFTLVFIRYLIALALLLLIAVRNGEKIVPSENKAAIFQIGFFGYFLSIAAQFAGTKLSSAHMGAMVTSLSPFFQATFAIVLLREKISVRQTAATIISFVGIMIIIGIPESGKAGGQWGTILLLLAALFWGYYSVLAKKLASTYSALQITTAGILLAAILTAPAAVTEAGDWIFADILTWPMLLSLLYLGIISTAVAFFCWNKGLSLLPAQQAGLFFFLQPLVGSLLGWAVLDETITAAFLAGSLCILGGIYFTLTAGDSQKRL